MKKFTLFFVMVFVMSFAKAQGLTNMLNTPPIFTSTPITSINENTNYNYPITSSDIDGDMVTITAPTLPSWLNLVNEGVVTTLAGSILGFTDGTAASVAKFNSPFGVATDKLGNVYVADLYNSKIRKITPSNKLSGDTTSQLGPYNVVLNANDGYGGSTNQSFTITVNDITKPIVLTQDITVSLDSIGQVSITPQQIDNGTTDNSGSFTLSFDAGQGHFTCADVGPNTVTLVATDASSNFATATAVVTVVDTMAPTAVAKDFVLDLDDQGTGNLAVSQINNGSTDNCSIPNLSLDKTNFTCADVGVQQVTLTATDNSGNVSTATANVTVRDITSPVVFTQNVTVTLDANGTGSVTASQFDNGSTDACGIDPNGYSLVLNAPRGTSIDFANLTCADVGVHTVTLQVTDNNGLVSSGTATLTVEDNVIPTLTGPANINTVATSASGAVVIYTSPVGLDNCTPTTTMIAGLASGSTFPIGITPVTYTVTDPSGNSASYTFNVVVIGSGEDDDHGDHHDDDDHSDNDDDHHNGHGDNNGDDDHNGSESNKTKVIIYPNPVEDEAEVALNIKKKGEGEVKVYDYKGHKIFSKKVKNLKKGVKVNMKGKKTGNYYVRIKYKGKTYTATLFKKR